MDFRSISFLTTELDTKLFKKSFHVIKTVYFILLKKKLILNYSIGRIVLYIKKLRISNETANNIMNREYSY